MIMKEKIFFPPSSAITFVDKFPLLSAEDILLIQENIQKLYVKYPKKELVLGSLDNIMHVVKDEPGKLLNLPGTLAMEVCDWMLAYDYLYFLEDEFCHWPFSFCKINHFSTFELIKIYNRWGLHRNYSQIIRPVPARIKTRVKKRFSHAARTLYNRRWLIYQIIEERGYKITGSRFLKTIPVAKQTQFGKYNEKDLDLQQLLVIPDYAK